MKKASPWPLPKEGGMKMEGGMEDGIKRRGAAVTTVAPLIGYIRMKTSTTVIHQPNCHRRQRHSP